MFGVGGIWAARDRFWPRVFDFFEPRRREPGASAGSEPAGTEPGPTP
jgi:hypothetical protein